MLQGECELVHTNSNLAKNLFASSPRQPSPDHRLMLMGLEDDLLLVFGKLDNGMIRVWAAEYGRSDAIHSASRFADSATNRREAASPAMIGRSPSGGRTARRSLRVDPLISIRFMAQRPSQSSACAAVQVGSATSWAVTAHPRAMHGNLAFCIPVRRSLTPIAHLTTS